jgi:ubiquinone biosynthesis protein
VKFGQILSTRQDMVPAAYTHELRALQDNVAPFAPDVAVAIIEADLKKPIMDVFQSFTTNPLASASVAQVHAATLPTGEAVVVKILRPGIKKVIERDIAMMRTFARLVTPILSGGKRLKLLDVIREFEHHILNELNLVREAGNASQIRRNYLDSDMLYVPEVYWDYCTEQLLVLERIEGVSIADVDALQAAGVDLEQLAKMGLEIFFSQVFKDRFFHADMHPGNIFVDISSPKKPRYVAVDFGIVGALSEMDQRYIAENFLAFFRRDYAQVAKLHVDSGWVPADTRVDQFEMDIRAVCEPVFAKPLKDIGFGKLLFNLFQTAKRYHMTVQPQLILLQKTLFAVEALGRRLYPDLNLWDTAQPYLENWVKERVGLKGAWLKTQQQLPFWLEKFPEAPNLLLTVLERAAAPEPIQPKQGPRVFIWLGIGVVLGIGVNYLYTTLV